MGKCTGGAGIAMSTSVSVSKQTHKLHQDGTSDVRVRRHMQYVVSVKGSTTHMNRRQVAQGAHVCTLSLFHKTLSTSSARDILCSFTATSCPGLWDDVGRPWLLAAVSPLTIVRVTILPGLSLPTKILWKFSGVAGCPSTFRIASPRPRARLL
jgi:hypothetical protein